MTDEVFTIEADHELFCPFCRHWDSSSVTPRCAAFPDGIPDALWIGENNHRAPVAGDHGIQFAPLLPSEIIAA